MNDMLYSLSKRNGYRDELIVFFFDRMRRQSLTEWNRTKQGGCPNDIGNNTHHEVLGLFYKELRGRNKVRAERFIDDEEILLKNRSR